LMYGLKPVPFNPHPSTRTFQPAPFKLIGTLRIAHAQC